MGERLSVLIVKVVCVCVCVCVWCVCAGGRSPVVALWGGFASSSAMGKQLCLGLARWGTALPPYCLCNGDGSAVAACLPLRWDGRHRGRSAPVIMHWPSQRKLTKSPATPGILPFAGTKRRNWGSRALELAMRLVLPSPLSCYTSTTHPPPLRCARQHVCIRIIP